MILKSKTMFDITQDDISIINITNKDLIKLRKYNIITLSHSSTGNNQNSSYTTTCRSKYWRCYTRC